MKAMGYSTKKFWFYLVALTVLSAFITYEVTYHWLPRVFYVPEESVFVYDRDKDVLYITKFGNATEDPMTWKDIYRVLQIVNATNYTTIIIGNLTVVEGEA